MMALDKGLVSIVVPAYNAALFMRDTINSVIAQTYPNWEMWVIDDGSTDITADVVLKFTDKRITLISKKNEGVSVSRNIGLDRARGEFIVFFDADDIMPSSFLQTRVKALEEDATIGFVGGLVETFPNPAPLRRAVAEDPEKEIHFFDATVATIPSNYLFRTSVILDHKIRFNPVLHSSADRFFLLEVAKFTKGKSLPGDDAKLLYRVSESSMSHHVTPKLIKDYYKFYQELNAKNLLPLEKRREIRSRYLFSIASSFSLVKYWGWCSKLLLRSFFTHPGLFMKLATRKVFKGS